MDAPTAALDASSRERRPAWSGHYYTIVPNLIDTARQPSAPPAVTWATTIDDPTLGLVPLRGWLHEPQGSRAASPLVVLVHGLGGHSDSRYLRRAATRAAALGLSSLRLGLRGADGDGIDLHHAGQSEDLCAVIDALPERFRDIYLLGYSLGGHLVLRAATQSTSPRLRAAAAICAPLDLEPVQAAIDHPRAWIYRRWVLRGIWRSYEPIAARHPHLPSMDAVRDLTTVRGFDEHVIAPRFGFADAADYYRQASVAAHLGSLRVPALLLATEDDPMVPAPVLRRTLAGVDAPRLEIRWLAGGHLGLPAALDVHGRALRWMQHIVG
ncbi:MAG: alpha/beta fold hydrolase [Acidobacteriota bacterium]